MSRYIDADAFDKEILSGWVSQALGVSHRRKYTIGEIRGMIQKRPTADVVPVVRCKDCKHRKNGGLHRSEKDGWTVVYDVPCNLGDDGFCSRGEKVTE